MDSISSWLQNDIGGDALHAWIAAIVLVVATGAVSAILTRIIRKLMQVDGSPLPESSIIINVVRIVVWVIGLSIMLSACFNVDVNGLIAALGIGGVALSLGVQDTVTSPTFTIVNEYRDGTGEPVYHFDFYRINRLSEALDIGLYEYFDSGALCLVEWPEMIEELLPEDALKVQILVEDAETRTLLF